MKDKKVQMIYTYLVNYVKNNDIKDLVNNLRDYYINGSMVDYEELNEYLEDFDEFLNNLQPKK